MNKTKIEYVDYTWNPVSGCLNSCPYCYARRITERFGLDFAPKLDDPEMEGACKYDSAEGMDTMLELEKPYTKGGRIQPYPMAFLPTFHKYRLNEPARKTKGQKIFVCSMADLFGDWVPDEWIIEVFKACEKAPQHQYLFLTKNPERYWQLHENGILPDKDNFWYGATLTHGEDEHEVANNLPAYTGLPKPTFRNTFVSAEPILDNIEGAHPMGGFFTYYPHTIKWAILGAETGSRKGKVIPRREWIESIVSACHKADVPVFMKNSLKDLMGDDFIQEWPEGLKG